MHTWVRLCTIMIAIAVLKVSKVLHDIIKLTSDSPTCLGMQCKDTSSHGFSGVNDVIL